MIKAIITILLISILPNIGFSHLDYSYSNDYILKGFLDEFKQKGKWVENLPYGTWSKQLNNVKIKISFKKKSNNYYVDFIKIKNDTIYRELSVLTFDNQMIRNVVYSLITSECSTLYDSLAISLSENISITKIKCFLMSSSKKSNNKQKSIAEFDTSVLNVKDKFIREILYGGFEIKSILIINDKSQKLYSMNISYNDKIVSYLNTNTLKCKKNNAFLPRNEEEEFSVFNDTNVLVKGNLEKSVKNGVWYYAKFCSNTLIILDTNYCGSLNIDYKNDIMDGFFVVRNSIGEGILLGRMKNNLPVGNWIGENNIRYEIK